MADSNRLDTLMMLMALKAMGNNLESKSATPFSVSIQITPTSISCHSEGNKRIIEDIGGQEWLKETQEKIAPIMEEQTAKFAELVGKKFGLSFGETHKSSGGMEDILKELFGGY